MWSYLLFPCACHINESKVGLMFCKKCTLKNIFPLKTPKLIIGMLLKQSSLHVQVTKTCLNLCSMKELGLLPLIRDGMLAVLCRSHSSILLGFSSSSQVPNNTPESRRHCDNIVLAQEHNRMLQLCLKHGTLNAHSSANHYVSVVSPTFYVSDHIQILWSQVSNHN